MVVKCCKEYDLSKSMSEDERVGDEQLKLVDLNEDESMKRLKCSDRR